MSSIPYCTFKLSLKLPYKYIGYCPINPLSMTIVMLFQTGAYIKQPQLLKEARAVCGNISIEETIIV